MNYLENLEPLIVKCLEKLGKIESLIMDYPNKLELITVVIMALEVIATFAIFFWGNSIIKKGKLKKQIRSHLKHHIKKDWQKIMEEVKRIDENAFAYLLKQASDVFELCSKLGRDPTKTFWNKEEINISYSFPKEYEKLSDLWSELRNFQKCVGDAKKSAQIYEGETSGDTVGNWNKENCIDHPCTRGITHQWDNFVEHTKKLDGVITSALKDWKC